MRVLALVLAAFSALIAGPAGAHFTLHYHVRTDRLPCHIVLVFARSDSQAAIYFVTLMARQSRWTGKYASSI